MHRLLTAIAEDWQTVGLHGFALLAALALMGCDDYTRPNVHDARLYFRLQNPTAFISDIYLNEDEAGARTFRVDYTERNSPQVKEVYVLYNYKEETWRPMLIDLAQ